MLVVKPWIEASPAPLTSQLDAGSPGFWFSQTIGLIVAPQLLCACIAILELSVVASKQSAATAPSTRRSRNITLLDIGTPLGNRERHTHTCRRDRRSIAVGSARDAR